jgi:hypothetical protein
MERYNRIKEFLIKEHSDIFVQVTVLRQRSSGGSTKIRGSLKDGSFLDIYLSKEGKYSYHWERRALDGKIFRWDNAPDHPEVETFPRHFHSGTDDRVEASKLPDNPKEAIIEIVKFIREII